MKKKLPGLVLTVGILNLLIAIPCGGCSAVNAVFTAAAGIGNKAKPPQAKATTKANNPWAPPPPAANKGVMDELQEELAFMDKEVPGYTIEQILQSVIVTLVCLCLGIAGVGLFMGKSWGKKLTIGSGIVWSVWTIFHVAYTVILVVPAEKKLEQMREGNVDPAFNIGMLVGSCLIFVIPVGYTIMTAAFLMNSKVRDYFAHPYVDRIERDPLEEPGPVDRYMNDEPDDRWGS